VTHIGEKAFSWSVKLTSITIPGSVKIIGDEAFSFCDSLTSVTIGNGVTTIGDGVFGNCHRLKSVTIPKSVRSVGDCAFAACFKMESITVLNPKPPKIGDRAFVNNRACLYIPARNYFAYRASDWWNELDSVKPIVTSYEIIVLSILTAIILSAALFIIIKKPRKARMVSR